MKTIEFTEWKNLPAKSAPGGDSDYQVVFTAPDPLPDSSRKNGLISVRQNGGPSADFSATYQGVTKTGNQSNGVSFPFLHNPPVPGRNVVTVTVRGAVDAIVGELKVGSTH